MNDTARVITRPSTSGSATCMARSRAESPCAEFCQASRAELEKIACSTTAPVSSSTVDGFSLPGAETAKPVALITTSGAASAKTARSVSTDTASFRLVTNTGRARIPCPARASISASTGFVSPLWTRAR
ncbi:hypothetical protein M8R20_15525 [Pseudomonas sp. R2.Fl]|nr:hypothetical protein [Pseudomonas sp. R2.Fl]